MDRDIMHYLGDKHRPKYVYICLFKAFGDTVKNQTYLWGMPFKGDDASVSIDDNLCKLTL